jgi:hypothetical protein
MQEYPELGPEEQLLFGAGSPSGTGDHDDVDRRILWLIRHRLIKRAIAEGGWDQLYRDPSDGRFWELTFPQGSLHGGGPRRLSCLSRAEVEAKYGPMP